MLLKLSRYNLSIPINGKVFLYNTLSGSSVFIAENEYSALMSLFNRYKNNGEIDPQYNAIIDLLIDNGFAVSIDTDEYDKAIKKYNSDISDSQNFALTIAPTMNCNMRCHYCFQDKAKREHLHGGDIDSIIEFIEQKLIPGGNFTVRCLEEL